MTRPARIPRVGCDPDPDSPGPAWVVFTSHYREALSDWPLAFPTMQRAEEDEVAGCPVVLTYLPAGVCDMIDALCRAAGRLGKREALTALTELYPGWPASRILVLCKLTPEACTIAFRLHVRPLPGSLQAHRP